MVRRACRGSWKPLALAAALEFKPKCGGQAGDRRLRSLFSGRNDARGLLLADGLPDGGPACPVGGGREGRLGWGLRAARLRCQQRCSGKASFSP